MEIVFSHNKIEDFIDKLDGVLLNRFIKKVWAIPRKEIEYARKIFELYVSKHA